MSFTVTGGYIFIYIYFFTFAQVVISLFVLYYI